MRAGSTAIETGRRRAVPAVLALLLAGCGGGSGDGEGFAEPEGRGVEVPVVAREHSQLSERAGLDQRRCGSLHRRRHRQIGIADEFETFERGGNHRVRTVDSDPAQFHIQLCR